MSPICPATGHVFFRIKGPNCPDHGVRWFEKCPNCGAVWSLVWPLGDYKEFDYGVEPQRASDFCAGCAAPAPWLTRERLIEWIQDSVKASTEVPPSARYELLEVLGKLKAMARDDTKAVAGWERLREAAPKVWNAMKPVRDALLGEAVKKALGLYP